MISVVHNLSSALKSVGLIEFRNTMKDHPKDPEHWTFSKLMVFFLVLISVFFILYSLRFFNHSYACDNTRLESSELSDASDLYSYGVSVFPNDEIKLSSLRSEPPIAVAGVSAVTNSQEKTNLSHVVFGIAASAKLWNKRKEYIKIWWRPEEMRGVVWLDKDVESEHGDETLLPPVKISGDTSKFKYKNPKGHRSAIRISRIVSETLRLGMEDVRWFVMGDDDTVFIAENLLKVLQKYDHNQFYYIGSSSESHLQNIYFSYNMAYGGGGFAISYPLAKALAQMQDRCIERYPALYGSDDRMQACMAELGVPLTRERGFHQFDVYGKLFGLLAAHPVTPLVSLHHLDLVEPIFPSMNRVDALKLLKIPMKLDPYGLMQQSICYDKNRTWTVSVSWGYAVQIFRGIFSPREIEMPARTFLNWYRNADYMAYAFNTRPMSRNVCQRPFIYHMTNSTYNGNEIAGEYVRTQTNPDCRWKMPDPAKIQRVKVYKKPDPQLWDRAPRRNCCRVLPTKKEGTVVVDVGVCHDGEMVVL